jgi:quercetin dioxygenase-like cupin family protein
LATSRRAPVHSVALKVFRFEAECSTLAHDHGHRHEVYVLAGSGVAAINGQERPIGVADHVSVAAGAAHAFRSAELGLEFLCVEWQEPSGSSTPARRE